MTTLGYYLRSALGYQRQVHGWRYAARYFWAHRRWWNPFQVGGES